MAAARRKQPPKNRGKASSASSPPIATRRHATRSAWLVVTLGLALVALIGWGLVSWRDVKSGGDPAVPGEAGAPDIPRVDDLTTLDPLVAAAIRDAIARLEQEPASAARWGELGIVYNAHRYYALAERCYAEAARLDAASAEWPHLHGVLAEERGDAAAAASLYRAALERAPDDVAARYRLGGVLLEMGSVDDAERAFAQLDRARPGDPWGALGLGRVALRRGEHAEAVRQLERVLASDPRNDQAAYLLASAYRELGKTDEARGLAERAREGVRPRAPPDPYVDRVRGAMRNLQTMVSAADRALEQGDAATAEATYLQVLAVDAANYDALYKLGMLYGRNRRYSEALPLLERAVEARPASSEPRMLLALALISLDRPDAAAAQLRELIARDPENGVARAFLQQISGGREG